MDRSESTSTLAALVGAVTHDLMNAVTVVTCDVGLALNAHAAKDDLNALLHQAEEAARQAEELIKSLMAFIRPTQAHLSPCDLREVVRRSARLARRAVPENVALHAETEVSPLIVRADIYLLEYVLVFLTLRAVEALPDGGRILLRADVRGPQPGGEVEPSVPASSLAVLTVKTEPADGSVHSALKQPGFLDDGSELCSILEAHDARCECIVDSSGSHRYEVALPFDTPGSSESKPAERPFADLSILLVTGDLMTQGLLRTVLEGRRYVVRVIPDAAKAVSLVTGSSFDVAAVIWDAASPTAPWETDVAQLRRARNDLPILILGADEAEATSTGPRHTAHLPQPYSPHDLLILLEKLLAESRAAPHSN